MYSFCFLSGCDLEPLFQCTTGTNWWIAHHNAISIWQQQRGLLNFSKMSRAHLPSGLTNAFFFLFLLLPLIPSPFVQHCIVAPFYYRNVFLAFGARSTYPLPGTRNPPRPQYITLSYITLSNSWYCKLIGMQGSYARVSINPRSLPRHRTLHNM